jgi:hypothetical protein
MQKLPIEESIKYIRETDMAVVVSSSQNEIAEMRERGVEIEPHRRQMVNEDLATKFKDPNDPFRIVFVCAMWMTGFDVPSCSTIYLDKSDVFIGPPLNTRYRIFDAEEIADPSTKDKQTKENARYALISLGDNDSVFVMMEDRQKTLQTMKNQLEEVKRES